MKLRSLLFVPADSERKFAKADTIGADALILEQIMTGSVIGEMFGLPGNGRRINFRMLHVFEFRDGLISRENVWLDGGTIVAQLTA